MSTEKNGTVTVQQPGLVHKESKLAKPWHQCLEFKLVSWHRPSNFVVVMRESVNVFINFVNEVLV
jgi:hypothetical protein